MSFEFARCTEMRLENNLYQCDPMQSNLEMQVKFATPFAIASQCFQIQIPFLFLRIRVMHGKTYFIIYELVGEFESDAKLLISNLKLKFLI